MQYVLFVCGHNAGRSQMAQALFNYLKTGFPRVDAAYQAISAGTRPGERLNPAVAESMATIGIPLDDRAVYFPKGLDEVRSKGKDVRRIIVACDDTCTLPPEIDRHLQPEYWSLPDPHGRPVAEVYRIRDMTQRKVGTLLRELSRELRQR